SEPNADALVRREPGAGRGPTSTPNRPPRGVDPGRHRPGGSARPDARGADRPPDAAVDRDPARARLVLQRATAATPLPRSGGADHSPAGHRPHPAGRVLSPGRAAGLWS